MRSLIAIAVLLIACGMLAPPAEAITRINGNQLIASSFEYQVSFRQMTAGTQSEPRASHLIFALGQGIIADGRLVDSTTSTTGPVAFRIGIGLGFDIATVVYNAFCPIQQTGDLNVDSEVNIKDLLMLVNFVFKEGPFPLPCMASGDVNCSGNVTTADAMYLVEFLFKGGPAPCDVCALIPGTWSCP